MNKNGPIVVIEDDPEDQGLLIMAFNELNYFNEMVFLPDGEAAFDYLKQDTVHPFLIISDVNMPKITGFQLRDMLLADEQTRGKCSPFVFFSTTISQAAVNKAYELAVQGFFTKPASYKELLNTVARIVEYWKLCKEPDQV